MNEALDGSISAAQPSGTTDSVTNNAMTGDAAQPDAVAAGVPLGEMAEATGDGAAAAHTVSPEDRMQDALIWIDLEMTGEPYRPRRWFDHRRCGQSGIPAARAISS